MSVKQIPIDKIIVPRPYTSIGPQLYGQRCRRDFPRMAESIKKEGLLCPIVVVPSSAGRYRLLDGKLRLSAVKSLGHKTIKAHIHEQAVV